VCLCVCVCVCLVHYFLDTVEVYVCVYVCVCISSRDGKQARLLLGCHPVPSSRSDLLPIVAAGLKRYQNSPRVLAVWRTRGRGNPDVLLPMFRFSDHFWDNVTTELLLYSPSTRNSLRANPMQFKRIYKDWPKRRLVAPEIDRRVPEFTTESYPLNQQFVAQKIPRLSWTFLDFSEILRVKTW